MDTSSLRYAVIAALTLGGAINVHAADRIVNISGQHALCNGCTWAPLAEPFEAGSYVATPVVAGSYPGAQFTAYNYGMGLGWSSAYAIALDAGHILDFGSNGPAPGAGWPSEAAALEHTAVGAFTLAHAQNVYFGVADSFYGDNFGGVSLRIAPVAEPEVQEYMLAGLAVLGWAYRRLRRRPEGSGNRQAD